MIYKAIGKGVVKLAVLFVRRRFATQLRFAAGFAVVAVLLGGYLASRDVREG